MKTRIHIHYEADKVVDQDIYKELLTILQNADFNIVEGCGKDLRDNIITQLKNIGWSDEFKLNAISQITITSILSGHLLCFQTGNMGRFYADLLKLQYAYLQDTGTKAIYIIPTKDAAKIMGSNIANFERLVFEIELFKEIITIPTIIIGIE